jgi:hypothetical protein
VLPGRPRPEGRGRGRCWTSGRASRGAHPISRRHRGAAAPEVPAPAPRMAPSPARARARSPSRRLTGATSPVAMRSRSGPGDHGTARRPRTAAALQRRAHPGSPGRACRRGRSGTGAAPFGVGAVLGGRPEHQPQADQRSLRYRRGEGPGEPDALIGLAGGGEPGVAGKVSCLRLDDQMTGGAPKKPRTGGKTSAILRGCLPGPRPDLATRQARRPRALRISSPTPDGWEGTQRRTCKPSGGADE